MTMKKILFAALLSVFSTASLAERDFHGNCEFIDFDDPKASVDSATFYFNEFQIEFAAGDARGIKAAAAIVTELGYQKGCGIDTQALEVKSSESGCQELVPGVEESTSCFVKTNLGDFFVMKDALGGAQIVYNRLD